MSKGDDAVLRRKNKVSRKRMRSSRDSSSTSARVASVIASKRRRKAGKRRICEGMCFSLPTPDDPFNDRNGKEDPEGPRRTSGAGTTPQRRGKKPPVAIASAPNPSGEEKCSGGGTEDSPVISKFLVLCLKAIQDSWPPSESVAPDLLARKWGLEFWKRCSSGSSVVDETTGAGTSREQVAWVVSTASDMVATKEEMGVDVPSPFLLYIVPSQEKAVEVRAVCKPLKALGIHAVSLHSGASLEHQILGLESCEPEFLVSTPERLLELDSMGAIDISGVSLLVIDGVKDAPEFRCLDKVKLIREKIPSDSQIVVFGGLDEMVASAMKSLLKGSVYTAK